MISEDPEKILTGKRVLIAEDQPMNVDISRDILERKGMEVVSAENGHVALATFQGSPVHYFDLILMDLQMGKTRGRAGDTDHRHERQRFPRGYRRLPGSRHERPCRKAR